MSVLPVGFGSATNGGGGFNVERSLRFNSADSAYLNRTFTTPTNAKKFTISTWVKLTSPLGSALDFGLLCGPNSAEVIGVSGTGAFGAAVNGRLFIRFGDTNLVYYPQLFRDVSAWAHIVVAIDTDQAVQADRAKFYYNGVLQTATSSTITSGYSPALNTAATRYIGALSTFAGYYANGYLAEYNFIDGQQLAASSFGETDSNTGVWKPKAYSGTYGTNGFYLKFADNSGTTSTTLGKDSSGNGNNWTPNNFSVTAGSGNDSLVDSPTSYGTDTGAGGEVRGNYCTMNPLTVATLPTLANGNLDVSVSATGVKIAQGTFQFPSSGKWYYECTFNNASSGVNGMFIGITSPTRGPNVTRSTAGAYFFYASSSGLLNSNGTDIVTGLSTISANEVFKVAVDIDNSKVWIGRGSTWYNSSGGTTGDPAAGTNPTFSISASGLTPMSGFDASSVSLSMNFGQRAWAQTCPSGFKALCTQNLPTPTIGATSTTQANDYFNTILYTGTGSSNAQTGVGFQPDLVWIKGRSGATDHGWYDAVRGVQKQLESNTTTAETTETTGLTAFGTDGFTVGALAQLNTSSATYVAWNWKANGAGSTNTTGTITSTVSANTTSGFSIVTWTGNGVSNATVGHGLGVTPAMIILKDRDVNGSNDNWFIWHQSLAANRNLFFTTGAVSDITALGGGGIGTSPTSSVFTLANGSSNNQNVNENTDRFVAYCFAAVAGYSAFGSYTGNGSADGPFVYTGFRPAYVLVKRTDLTGYWHIWDAARNTYNLSNLVLFPNVSDAESTYTAPDPVIDMLSNGFKHRGNYSHVNASGGTYIYMALAENPFKYSLAR